MYWPSIEFINKNKQTILSDMMVMDDEDVLSVTTYCFVDKVKSSTTTIAYGREVVAILAKEDGGEREYFTGLHFERACAANGAVSKCLDGCREGPSFESLGEGIHWLVNEGVG
jgi:hypothetical protein